MFEEKVLLQIKRQYGKDESIAFLLDTVSCLKKEVGILKSERDEALYKVDQFSDKSNNISFWKAKEDIVSLLVKNRDEWKEKYISLIKSTEL